jgi:hypothetical protein
VAAGPGPIRQRVDELQLPAPQGRPGGGDQLPAQLVRGLRHLPHALRRAVATPPDPGPGGRHPGRADHHRHLLRHRRPGVEDQRRLRRRRTPRHGAVRTVGGQRHPRPDPQALRRGRPGDRVDLPVDGPGEVAHQLQARRRPPSPTPRAG